MTFVYGFIGGLIGGAASCVIIVGAVARHVRSSLKFPTPPKKKAPVASQ